MAGVLVSDYSIVDNNIEALEETADAQRKGFSALSLTNMGNTSQPAIAAGSMFEINGALISFASEEAITVGAVSDGTVYILIDGTAMTAAFTATAPTWSDSKQGWYGTSGTANSRYAGPDKDSYYSMTKATTNYSDKTAHFGRTSGGYAIQSKTISITTDEGGDGSAAHGIPLAHTNHRILSVNHVYRAVLLDGVEWTGAIQTITWDDTNIILTDFDASETHILFVIYK
jgi:hypothetical protein